MIILNLLLGRHVVPQRLATPRRFTRRLITPQRLLWIPIVGHSMLRGSYRRLSCSNVPLIVILARIDVLIANEAKEVVEGRSEERAEKWTNPIDPVISGETAVDHIRTEGTSRVKRSSGKVVT